MPLGLAIILSFDSDGRGELMGQGQLGRRLKGFARLLASARSPFWRACWLSMRSRSGRLRTIPLDN